jgi:hypothetical protein
MRRIFIALLVAAMLALTAAPALADSPFTGPGACAVRFSEAGESGQHIFLGESPGGHHASLPVDRACFGKIASDAEKGK